MREIKIVVPDINDMLPEEVVSHLIKAFREVLLAMRSFIDASLEKLDTAEELVKAKKEIKKIEID